MILQRNLLAFVLTDFDSKRPVRRRVHAVRTIPRARASATVRASPEQRQVLLLGGTGRIGSAAAIHLLQASVDSTPPVHVLLAGRGEKQGQQAVAEVLSEVGGIEGLQQHGSAVSFLRLDFTDTDQLAEALQGCDAVIHTAGPYMGVRPDILKATINAGVPCYVDVADPVEYLDEARNMSADARASGTMALVSAGAFPGLSNVIAVECASRLDAPAHDLDFYYFTAGLGGSGKVNLAITNFGFGDPVMNFRKGRLSPQMNAGLASEEVEFFLEESDKSYSRVGQREVWAWPFPEVYTVARELGISGNSNVKMGTAPAIWNVILGGLVKLVPRSWWRSALFSNGMASFSDPMVMLTDKFVGETHSIRVDASSADGATVSAVHGHDSFRRCVGQSVAEFALELMQRRDEASEAWRPGVYCPEEIVRDSLERERVLHRLTHTPGTFTFVLSSQSKTTAVVEHQ